MNKSLSIKDQSYLGDVNRLYYEIIVDDVWRDFKYDENVLKLGGNASFSELTWMNKGDCFRGAFLNVYVLKSLGVPATVDII